MEIKHTLVLDGSDPLSKALAQLDETPAVVITKNGRYIGLVDHRSVSSGIRDPANTKCESVMVKPPVLMAESDLLERVEAFMLGHFKALPVLDGNDIPLGITTRVELLDDMLKGGLIPPMKINELMSKPVYMIDENETVASARRVLKERNARRLVVTTRNHPVGVVSLFDMSAWEARPNMSGGRKNIRLADNYNVADMKLAGFLRPDITEVAEDASLQEAAQRMVQKQVSAVIIVSNKEPVGILSAMDIFKMILEMAQERLPIHISGLGLEDMGQYTHIRDKLARVLSKFEGHFNIRNVSLHVKEGKSTYQLSLYFDTDEGHVSMKEERGDLRETIDELSGEVASVLSKKKDFQRRKPRVTNARGRGKS